MAESSSSGRLLNTELRPTQELSRISTWDLGCNLLQRLEASASVAGDSYVNSQNNLKLFSQLRDALEKATDTVDNRATPRHLSGQMGFLHYCTSRHKITVRGGIHLDIGCGAVTPFSRMFAHLLAGAQRVGCLELEPIRDIGESVRHLARIAAAVAINPSVVFSGYPVTNRECLDNVRDFDLAKLAKGDATGLNPDRITFLQKSAADTGLPDAQVDLIVSNSVLEHVPDPEGTVRELARITKPGGFAMHGIDVADHRWYGTPSLSRIEFLTIATDDPIVHGCNRLRLGDFEALFKKHGFVQLERMPGVCHELPATLRERLVPPWRDLSHEELATTWCQYLFQKQ